MTLHFKFASKPASDVLPKQMLQRFGPLSILFRARFGVEQRCSIEHGVAATQRSSEADALRPFRRFDRRIAEPPVNMFSGCPERC